MTTKRGISLLDLLNIPPGSQGILPPDVAAQLEKLAILDYHSTTSDSAIIHYGTVQSLADMALPALREWPVQAPGLNTGLSFQLTLKRIAVGAGQNLEPAPDTFQLDLFLNPVAIEIPGLRPATLIPGGNGAPARLGDDPKRTKVQIVGSGVLRIALTPDATLPIVRFVDAPDPFDPDAPTGPVFTLTFSPPHFFLGASEFGLTVDRLTFDDSETFTPPDIIERGQPDSWRGIAIREATLYLPPNAPVVGDLSVGVRDVLLGSPFGLQGDIQIEFGRAPIDPAVAVALVQQVPGTEAGTTTDVPLVMTPRNPIENTPGRVFNVALQNNGGGQAALVNATFNSPTTTAQWLLPDLTIIPNTATGYFTAADEDILQLVPFETNADGQTAQGPQTTFVFQNGNGGGGGVGSPLPAQINVRLPDGSLFENVVHVSGTVESMQGLVFEADPPSPDLEWRFAASPVPVKGRGATFAPQLGGSGGDKRLLGFRDALKRQRIAMIEVVESGKLILGTEAGPIDPTASQNVIPMRDVQGTRDLVAFHRGDDLVLFDPSATLTSPTTLEVPDGAVALVNLELGVAGDPDATPDPIEFLPPLTEFTLFMEFDSTDVTPSSDEVALQTWAQSFRDAVGSFQDAKFVAIGRCDDIGSADYNSNLGQERAEAVRDLLKAAGVPTSKIFVRGEQKTWSAAGQPTGVPIENEIGLDALEGDDSIDDPNTDGGWLIKRKFNSTTRDGWGDDKDAMPRPIFRRVDVYIVDGTPSVQTPVTPQDEARQDPALRRIFIPGNDPSAAAPKPIVPPDSALPYRVRLIVRWDSPTVVELADAIPTMAELTIEWPGDPLPLDAFGTSGSVVATSTPTQPQTEILTFVGRWTYDARSGQTQLSLSVDSSGDPNGLRTLVSVEPDDNAATVLATALALGPALMGGISQTDVTGAAVRIGALIAASVAASAFARNGKVVLFGVEVQHRQQALGTFAGSRTRLLVDYTVVMGFEVDALGLKTDPEKPIRVRYKNVGIEFDDSREGLDKLGLVFEDVSFEVEDPGQWQMNGALGKLLGVTAVRAGAGSVWYEIDLAFALDLGVITISSATVRLTFEEGNVSIELRGLEASVEIPGTLKGSGALSVADSGIVSGALDMEIIPAGVHALGSLTLDPATNFTVIDVGTIFATGIPLASTGLALYGLMGKFVSNGTRNMANTSTTDPIQREIDWYRKPAVQKYQSQVGQWAIGLGAVVGTLPDGGFSFNALGALVVEFPQPLVVFSIDAKFISQPGPAQADGPPPGTLLGMISVDSEAVKLGIRGQKTIPHLLDFRVPVSGFFPLAGVPKDAYLRIGADGVEGRVGDPVSVTFLPGTLSLTSRAFLMIEEKKLHRLGGDDRFNFNGFSIGYGAGWGIHWSAGPITLNASAEVLVGLGTKPLMVVGAVSVRGELSLKVISISAQGDIFLKLLENEQRLVGEFCGKVDLFFFSIEGCVGIDVGTDPGDDIPVPPSPLLGIDLTDRRGIVTARAVKSGTPGTANTSWPDTVPLLHFAHYLDTALPANSSFTTPPEIPGPVWSGTSELKYAYRLVGIEIKKQGGSVLGGPLDAAWWLPAHRPGVAAEGDVAASDHEGRDLALLTWHPAPWARNLGDNVTPPADPATTIERLCDPTPTASHVCVPGQTMRRLGVDRVRLVAEAPGETIFPGDFRIEGREFWGTLSLETVLDLLTEHGIPFTPGHIVELPDLFVLPDGGAKVHAVYELPSLNTQGSHWSSLEFEGQFAPAVVTPDVILTVTHNPKQSTVAGCDRYDDLAIGTSLPATFVHNTLTYTSLDSRTPISVVDRLPIAGRDKRGELMFPAEGMQVRLPVPVRLVTLEVAQLASQSVTITARNFRGEIVATATTTKQGVAQSLTLEADEVVELTLSGGGGKSVLAQLCFEGDTRRGFPLVTGRMVDGTVKVWEPNLIGTMTDSATGVKYDFVQYTAPSDAQWHSFTVAPWFRAKVGVVSTCGVSWMAAQAQAEDQAARDRMIDRILGLVANNTPERQTLLDANSTYEIKVRWQFQGWRRTDDQQEPPPINDALWENPIEELYRFKTAAAATTLTAPVNFLNESVFDPRAVARYLVGFEPANETIPHFLDDPVLVRFSVDHLEALLATYNRSLIVKVRRTDPLPGTIQGLAHPPDLPLTITQRPLDDEFLFPSDQRLREAFRNAPCLDEPPLGGTTLNVTTPLVAGATYDLMVVAPPTTNPTSDEILIGRTHFRASRYRNPGELLQALGFTLTTPFTLFPRDVMVEGALPLVPALGSDEALETTLAELGMQAFPLATAPRTVALWRFLSGQWRLVGLLLESDEPIVRPDRLTVSHAFVAGTQFLTMRSNVAGTRLLMATPTPVVVPADAVMNLTIFTPTGTVTGRRYLAGGPRVLLEATP